MAPMKDEFQDAFDGETPLTAESSADEAFGLVPDSAAPKDADGDGVADDLPIGSADVVVVTGKRDGSDEPAEERAANDAAAAEAKAEADKANAARDGDTQATSADAEAGKGADVAAADGAGDDMGLDDLSDVPAEDMQKAKSWQGRLKKIEAQLKAKADAMAAGTPEAAAMPGSSTADQAADALEQVADKAEASDPEMAASVDQVADQVASGEMDPDEAMKVLAEDFGESFVKMIEAIARRVAGTAAEEKVATVGKSVEDLIGSLTNERQAAHFEAIYDVHPDFMDIAQDPAFLSFVEAKGPEAQATVENGKAGQINALLTEFKSQAAAPAAEEAAPAVEAAAAPAAEPAMEPVVAAAEDPMVDEDDADAAEGVSSAGGGLRLPEKPVADNDDYEAAWREFS